MPLVTPESLANLWVMDRATMEKRFIDAREKVEQAHKEYEERNLLSAHKLLCNSWGFLASIPDIVEKNGFSDAEGIIAEAKKIVVEAIPAKRECSEENDRQLIRRLIREKKIKKRMEKTSLEDRLEKAVRFKEELEIKVRENDKKE